MLPTTTSKASYLPRAALKSNNFYDRFAPYQHVERKDAIPTATSVPTRADPGRRMGRFRYRRRPYQTLCQNEQLCPGCCSRPTARLKPDGSVRAAMPPQEVHITPNLVAGSHAPHFPHGGVSRAVHRRAPWSTTAATSAWRSFHSHLGHSGGPRTPIAASQR
jgi:hypothetical protein